MSDFKDRIEEYLADSVQLSKRHVHPRLLTLFELGGMGAHLERAEGQYMWDSEGERYLDLLAGGGVYFMGRNNAYIHNALQDMLSMNIPNMTVVNASALGGMLADRLLAMAGGRYSKVVFANSGSESNEVALRFARQVTRRRRYLYLEGSFHGRSYGAVSVCGWKEMRTNIEPAMPTCTPVRRNDIRQLRRELRMGDVAGFIFEPLQGMTGELLDAAYLREAENLCEQYGTIMIADEVQTGLGRTGDWFATSGMGVRPHIMTLSKALSGGAVPVAAVLVDESIYDRVYKGFGSGMLYFSTFAENNLAMVAGLATLDVLEELDAPAEATWKGDYLRRGLEVLQEKYDVIDRITGKGLMLTVYFKESHSLALKVQQKAMNTADGGAFGAAVHVDLFARQKIIAQLPGPGVSAIKILPPVICTQEDLDYFLSSFEDTLSEFYGANGPVISLGRGVLDTARKKLGEFIPPLMRDSEKKNSSSMT